MVTGDDIRGTSSRFVVLIHKLQRPFESPPFTRTEVDPVGRWASWRTAPPLSAWTGKGVADNWGVWTQLLGRRESLGGGGKWQVYL